MPASSSLTDAVLGSWSRLRACQTAIQSDDNRRSLSQRPMRTTVIVQTGHETPFLVLHLLRLTNLATFSPDAAYSKVELLAPECPAGESYRLPESRLSPDQDCHVFPPKIASVSRQISAFWSFDFPATCSLNWIRNPGAAPGLKMPPIGECYCVDSDRVVSKINRLAIDGTTYMLLWS
jgi:hypothetical protein